MFRIATPAMPVPRRSRLLVAMALLAPALLFSACSGDEEGPRPGSTNGYNLAIVPESTQLAPGGTVDFDLKDPPPEPAIWEVLGGVPNGTIDQNGVYTAPASVPTPDTVLIRASIPGPFNSSAIAEVKIVAPQPADGLNGR